MMSTTENIIIVSTMLMRQVFGDFLPGGEKNLAHKIFFDFVYYYERRNYTITYIIHIQATKLKDKDETVLIDLYCPVVYIKVLFMYVWNWLCRYGIYGMWLSRSHGDDLTSSNPSRAKLFFVSIKYVLNFFPTYS